MARILFLASSAPEIVLADGSALGAGFVAEEATRAIDRFEAAGAQIEVATVDGEPPHIDAYALNPAFHFPDEDRDFFSAVVRRFMRDIDDIRITLQHVTEFDLVAAHRVFQVLMQAGVSSDEALVLVERSARTSWLESISFITVLSSDPAVTSRVSVNQLRLCRETLFADATTIALDARNRLLAMAGFQRPLKLGDISPDQITRYDAVFIPGGSGPMVDMVDSADIRRLLHLMAPGPQVIAALGHGVAALLSAAERLDGLWLFDGYRMTAFTNEEEGQTHLGKLGPAWYLETALKNRGAVFDDAVAWGSHVVIDRNLMTGQNRGSTDSLADAVLKRIAVLNRRAA